MKKKKQDFILQEELARGVLTPLSFVPQTPNALLKFTSTANIQSTSAHTEIENHSLTLPRFSQEFTQDCGIPR